MASTRKKLDEKNLKTLRELGALPLNKYCFDCNQRGPTYVNVTIGSFVCTKCSGMLRGITPPHRVKSISMATFTNEEIDLLKTRGNDYCRQVWLGLHEGGSTTTNSDDETAIKNFMVEKYEKRRYYLDPVNVKPIEESKAPKVNGIQVQPTQRPRPEVSRSHNRNNNNIVLNGSNANGFVADFDKADIFTGGGTTTTTSSNGSISNGTSRPQHHQNGFANFDDNPVFNSSINTNDSSTGFPTGFSNVNNNWNQANAATNLNGNSTMNGSLNGAVNANGSLNVTNGSIPSEDRYAALKDLDNELKSQKNGSLDWSNNSNSSNGSLYSSPTPAGSVYSSPSPQSSIFGSPSQGQFMTSFPSNQDNVASVVSNPFNTNGVANVNWSNLNNGMQPTQQQFANPFRDTVKTNGYTQGFQPIAAFPVQPMPLAVNGINGWTPNPFKVGGTNGMNTNNPFL